MFKENDLLEEVILRHSRSSGKGGQNVNKVSTKVELYFDVKSSAVLDAAEKNLLLINLKNKIGKKGIIRITSQGQRSQYLNKLNVINKFLKLIYEALNVPEKRIETFPTEESILKRRLMKSRKSEKKRDRKKIIESDD